MTRTRKAQEATPNPLYGVLGQKTCADASDASGAPTEAYSARQVLDGVATEKQWQDVVVRCAKANRWLVDYARMWYTSLQRNSNAPRLLAQRRGVTSERSGSRCPASLPFPVSANNAVEILTRSWLTCVKGAASSAPLPVIARIVLRAPCGPWLIALLRRWLSRNRAAGGGRASLTRRVMGAFVALVGVANRSTRTAFRTSCGMVRSVLRRIRTSTIFAAIIGASTPIISNLLSLSSISGVAWLLRCCSISRSGARTATRSTRKTATSVPAQTTLPTVEYADARKTLDLALTEKAFQNHVVHLARLNRWLVFHAFDARRSDPGFPDLTMVHPERKRVLFLELKRERGRVRPEQEVWIAALNATGRVEARIVRPSDWEWVRAVLSGEEVTDGEAD